ncbi:MAG: T9SS type A sorting domain-containing protein, partial [Ferruginibacter sp.]
TVLINGATNPVVFGFTTAPNITNNQVNNGGLHTLPVSFINVGAHPATSGVDITWTVGVQLGIDKYIVERSVDGRSFYQVGAASAKSGTANIMTYNFVDAAPLTGNSFYRIAAINASGKIEYSAIVRISMNSGNVGISLYPNPVIKNGRLNVELQNLQRDEYDITIMTNLGQQVAKKTIDHVGGNSVQTITLPYVTPGMYMIEVRNKNDRFVKKLIVE